MMKAWVQKLIKQFEMEVKAPPLTDPGQGRSRSSDIEISEDRATLLYIIDTYNKHLFEFKGQPIRKVRETLDEFSKELVQPSKDIKKTLFRFRQFFASYRLDEFTYILKTFDDFRGIVLDFVDQLSDDFSTEQAEDEKIQASLEKLQEAVECNSIDSLKTQSREFIDTYIEFQTKKDERRSHRLQVVRGKLEGMKEQLHEVNKSMRLDHLTQAFNRKSFDEHMREAHDLFTKEQRAVTLLSLDIDHFKKVNDSYGHTIGDVVLQECVKMLQDTFNAETDFVARVGGEEFAIILSNYHYEQAARRAEEVCERIRKETLIVDQFKIKFTISVGIAQLLDGESVDTWLKRADAALYESKKTGRDRWSIASHDQKPAA